MSAAKLASRFFLLIVLIAGFALPAAAPAFARSGPNGFADLAEKLLPAVVNISTSQTISANDSDGDMPDMPFPPGSPLDQFLHDYMNKQQQLSPGTGKDGTSKDKDKDGTPRKRKASALGSGFVIDPSGYIVTNNHVIEDADQITVILQDDTNLTATVVGRDKKTDLALLKVTTKKPLPSVTWGDSDKVRVGDWILAIGDPYGLGGTVTAGIISARARDINSGPYDEYLQTDAPINRGNSGGPMFDMDGAVVGVNTAIYSPSGGSIGIGFAIPSSLAKNIIDQLRDHGHIRRGWLGVRIQMVTQDIADSLNLGKPRGALVAATTPEGPAAKGGVQSGDVILTFDGKEVPEMHRLPLMVAETDVDRTIDISVFRKGQTVTLKVKVAELKAEDDKDDEQPAAPAAPVAPSSEKIAEIGVKTATLTDVLRDKYEVKKGVTGLLVSAVDADGLAADEGVQVGDVISQANQQDIKSANDLNEQIKTAKKDNKPLLLLVNRKDDLRFIALTLTKKK